MERPLGQRTQQLGHTQSVLQQAQQQLDQTERELMQTDELLTQSRIQVNHEQQQRLLIQDQLNQRGQQLVPE